MYFNGQEAQRYLHQHPTLYGTGFKYSKGQNIFVCKKIVQIVAI